MRAADGKTNLDVLVLDSVTGTRAAADSRALAIVKADPGAEVSVHRMLSRIRVETVSTVKLVRS